MHFLRCNNSSDRELNFRTQCHSDDCSYFLNVHFPKPPIKDGSFLVSIMFEGGHELDDIMPDKTAM
jgi:hypothetical protein